METKVTKPSKFQCTCNNLKNKAKNQLNLNQDPNSSKKKIVQKSRSNKVEEKSIYLQVAIGQRATHAYHIWLNYKGSFEGYKTFDQTYK
jgi:FKBP-type peptidyl-prolyl cis-trans isomerase